LPAAASFGGGLGAAAPAAAGMGGGTGLLGVAGTGAAASAPFAAAAGAPTMFSAPFSLGSSQAAQLNAANNMTCQPQQQQVRAPQPMPIQRGQAMKYPTLDELYKMQMAQAAPRFSLL
jgi:hypothetical protein